MATSTLDPDNFPAANAANTPPGHDIRSLGPSDSSDSGSDIAGPGLLDEMDDNSDRFGTGEYLAAGKNPRIKPNGDIGVDRVVGPNEAGLGGGLDQAEEARFGITDEEVENEND